MFQGKLFPLESKSHTLGNATHYIFYMQKLPKDYSVAALYIFADVDVTTAGAAARAPSNTIGLLVDTIRHESDFLELDGTGYLMQRLAHQMMGRTWANGTFGAAIEKGVAPLVIPLSDDRALSPDDTAIPCESLRDTTFEMRTTAATAVNLFGAAAVATVTFRMFALLTKGRKVAPAKTEIKYADYNSQAITLPGKRYTDLFVYKERTDTSTNAASITTTSGGEITRVKLRWGGHPIIDDVEAWVCALDWNRRGAIGGSEDNTLEQINDGSVPFLPILTPEDRYSILSLPGGLDSLSLDFSGSLTSFRTGWRAVAYRAQDDVRSGARDQLPPGTRVVPTLDFVAGSAPSPTQSAEAAQLLPIKLRGEIN